MKYKINLTLKNGEYALFMQYGGMQFTDCHKYKVFYQLDFSKGYRKSFIQHQGVQTAF